MPIIALVGNKGGAGKTTLSVNIAAGLARNQSTAVLDADPKGHHYNGERLRKTKMHWMCTRPMAI
jgi:cellulose biosynthesis protein BcsQ